MSTLPTSGASAAIAAGAAIGSAAIAAGLLFASKKRDRHREAALAPSGEKPETD